MATDANYAISCKAAIVDIDVGFEMKIAFNRQVRRSPWGGGAHFATAFADFLTREGHQVTYKLESDVDWIVMLDPRHEEGGFDVNQIADHKRRNPNVKVLHRINDTGKTRGGFTLDELIVKANQAVADYTVFISAWVRDYYRDEAWKGNLEENLKDRYKIITNGCDSTFFYSSNINTKPHTPIRLVTHHWSNNPSKGLDLYEAIDDFIEQGAPIEFTYVGRYPKTHFPKHTNIVEPLYGQALGDELRKHDVYVTAARWEACGSHHVEGAACGLPVIYHKDGGGVNEMCSRYGVEISNPGQLRKALTTIVENYADFRRRAESVDLTSETMCRRYLDFMENVK